MSMSDEDDFKRLLLGMQDYYCALCAQLGCLGYELRVNGENCVLTYHLCWSCRRAMTNPPKPVTRVRESTLDEVRRIIADMPETSTNTKLYTFVPN